MPPTIGAANRFHHIRTDARLAQDRNQAREHRALCAGTKASCRLGGGRGRSFEGENRDCRSYMETDEIDLCEGEFGNDVDQVVPVPTHNIIC